MNFFDEHYRAMAAAAFFEQLRIATRPITTASIDATYRTPGIDFRGAVLAPSIATSVSTASL
jgi:hypothetical protein